MDINFPPSYTKKKPIPKYRCDTCGNRKCREKRRVVCWTECRDWKPEIAYNSPIADVSNSDTSAGKEAKP